MMNLLHKLIYAVTLPLRMLLSSPSKVFLPLKWMLGLSQPVKWAIVSFVAELILVVVVFVADFYTPDRAAWSFFTSWWWFILILVGLIPYVTYRILKGWWEGEVSPFPEIDYAWKAGLAELQRQGLDLSQIPLFLILGSAGESHNKALFHASRQNFNMAEVPKGPNELHWYANRDGVYLVCTQAGRLSKLCNKARKVSEDESTTQRGNYEAPSGKDVRGTIVAESEMSFPETDENPNPLPDVPSADIRGTMEIPSDMIPLPNLPFSSPNPTIDKRRVRLDQHESIEADQRLAYLFRLIRRRRQPLCPINGILTLLPFGFIQRSQPDAHEIQRAVKEDLAAVLRVLMLRCPVTALVVDTEQDEGFQELVQRIGRDRSAGQRFGKGYPISNPPLPERLRALCDQACGSFEDWIYALFREPGSLSQTGNTRLYSLVVKIRTKVQSRLENILAEGFGIPNEENQQSNGLLFGGCYFAATGQTEDRQAFVKAVFDKLPEQQEDVLWTDAALRKDERLRQIAGVILLASCIPSPNSPWGRKIAKLLQLWSSMENERYCGMISV